MYGVNRKCDKDRYDVSSYQWTKLHCVIDQKLKRMNLIHPLDVYKIIYMYYICIYIFL